MPIAKWLKGFREGGERRDTAHSLYVTTVTQAREPAFYAGLGVPDSLDGRFDMVVLHVGLVLRRLGQTGEAGKPLSEELFSVMFGDLDQTVRDMGVGDLRVGKKVKAMARAFYGRTKAYDDALDSPDESDLVNAIRRNIYGPEAPETAGVVAVAGYVRQAVAHLEGLPDAELLAGEVSFPDVPTAADGG